MFFLFIVIFLNIFFLLLNLHRYKDFISPPVLFYFFWTLSLIGVLRIPIVDDIHFTTALILSLGALLFHIGFNMAFFYTIQTEDVSFAHTQYIKYAIIVLCLIFGYLLYDLIFYNSGDTLYKILTNKTNENLNLNAYLKKIIEFFSLGFLVIYFKNPLPEIRNQIKNYTIIFLMMGLLCVFSIPSRNSLLHFFMPLIVIFLSTHKISLKKQLAILFIGFALFMSYYALISANKYFYLYEKSNGPVEILSAEISTYLSGSIIAFDLTKDEHVYSRGGRNTFRFFYAIYDRFDGSKNAEKLVNDFFVGDGLSTNVFTFYDFYIRDFGYVYALIIQFCLSLLYGFIYKKRNTGQGLFLYALLTYPLVMQFFQDQYISLTSTWLQIILVSIVLFNTNLFQTRLRIAYNREQK